jgi:hypothetical protein
LEENALAMEAALEQLPTLNDVSVSYTIDGQHQIFHVEFETNVPTAVEFTVSSAGLSISDVDVCAGADDAAPYSSTLGDIGERELHRFTETDMDIGAGACTYTISELSQASNEAAGHAVRLHAESALGLGRPTESLTVKPMAVPSAPQTADCRTGFGLRGYSPWPA